MTYFRFGPLKINADLIILAIAEFDFRIQYTKWRCFVSQIMMHHSVKQAILLTNTMQQQK